MRNTITLSILLFFSSIMLLAQDTPAENGGYQLEIWEANITSTNDYYTLNLDIYNTGKAYKDPIVQAIYKDIIIANVDREVEDITIAVNSMHKVSLPIEIPNNYKGKKIKLEIIIRIGEEAIKEKMKVTIEKS